MRCWTRARTIRSSPRIGRRRSGWTSPMPLPARARPSAWERSPLRYAEVTFRIADGSEKREWRGWAGFTPARIHYNTLGFAGCLQFFTAAFHGDIEEAELTVNQLYPGT